MHNSNGLMASEVFDSSLQLVVIKGVGGHQMEISMDRQVVLSTESGNQGGFFVREFLQI